MAFNQIIGTSGSNNLQTIVTLQDIVLASGGDDVITADFQSTDYIVGGDGSDRLITDLNYTSFSIQSHPGIADGYIVRYTNLSGVSTVNIIKGVETFQFAEGSISLQDFISGAPLNQDLETVVLDSRGLIDNPETLDASIDDFLYKDDLDISNFVVIENFTQGDLIEISASQSDVVFVTNDGQDVIITNNSSDSGNVVISSITLIGVVSADDIVSDEATLEKIMGFDVFNINIV